MNSPVPTNETDQILLALQRSRAAFPDLCRCLCKGELFLLIRYQPDLIDATLEIKNGAPFPFARLQADGEETVPAYTSVERAQEGLAKCKVPSMQFVIGSMPALQALEVVGKMKYSMTLNKGCSTGSVLLPADLLRELADGTALKPKPASGQIENITLGIIDPANYPTEVVQAAFEVLRKHTNFRAAWAFTRSDAPDDYYMIVLMQPRDAALFHDFNLVVQSTGGHAHPVHTQLANENNPEQISVLFKCGPPFYQAVDYQPPANNPPE